MIDRAQFELEIKAEATRIIDRTFDDKNEGRFSTYGRRALGYGRQEADRLNHGHFGTEHILLGLMKDSALAGCVFENLDVDVERVRQEVEKLVKPGSGAASVEQRAITPNAARVLEFAIGDAIALNRDSICTEHLLFGLLRVHDCRGVQALTNAGVKVDDVWKDVMEFLGLIDY